MSKKERAVPCEDMSGQPLEDRALKSAARLFGEELMPLLGIEGKVRRIAPTEEVDLKPQDYLQDFNYEMTDGSWTHVEFESDSIRTEDLQRFRRILRMKDKNADQIFEELGQRQKDRRLERSELLEILLTPLMSGEMSQQERITRGFCFLRGEREYWKRER